MSDSSHSLIVRQAHVDDAHSIAQVHVRTWQHAYRGLIPDDYLDSLSVESRAENWKKTLISNSPTSHVYVAIIDEHIVGWCSGGLSRDDDATAVIGELYGIYVDPDCFGKGIGSALMSRLLDELKKDGYAQVTLWVLAQNEKSRWFYERRGWSPEGKSKDDVRENFVLHEVRYVYSF